MKKLKNQVATDQAISQAADSAASTQLASAPKSPAESVLPPRVVQLLARRKYSDACDQLRTLSRSAIVNETLGVCLLRCGQYEQAVGAFRSIALSPGSTIVRLDASTSLKINFATALTLAGLPSGGLELLEGLRDPDAMRLKAAINRWASTLSLLRWLDWKFSRIEPRGCCVPLDFEPGIFPFALEQTTMPSAENTLPGGSKSKSKSNSKSKSKSGELAA